MSTATEPTGAARKTRTYLPERESRDELLDFANFLRQVEEYLAENTSRAALVDPSGNTRPIPAEIFRILDQVTNAMAAGQGITVVPQGMTLTTQQAADFLGVSRPTVVRLMESGEIEFEKPGRHRRVSLQALVAYQSRAKQDRVRARRDLQKDSLRSPTQVGDPSQVRRLSELDGE